MATGINLQEVAEAVAATAPIDRTVARVPGRVLSVDGDMICYQAGGNDDTTVGQAREHARFIISRLVSWSGADKVIVHITAPGCSKGGRYAVALTQPYQGNRKPGRKPKHHQNLQDWFMSEKSGYRVKVSTDREADDMIAYLAATLPDHVIATKDKDMRMLPGHHVNWDTGDMFWISPTTYEDTAWGKVFGTAWFWRQMLQGDTADNIPNVVRLFGPAKANKALAPAEDDVDAFDIVSVIYMDIHGERWAERFAENACLLWLRRSKEAPVTEWFNWMLGACALMGGTLEDLTEAAAKQEYLVKENG